MKVKIEVSTDSDAFQEGRFHSELMTVLTVAACKAERQLQQEQATHCTHLEPVHKLLDSNGNTVGTVVLTHE